MADPTDMTGPTDMTDPTNMTEPTNATYHPERDKGFDAPLERMRRAVEHVEDLAQLMDSQFALPGTPIRLGLDALVGLIPGIGDTLNLGVAGYIAVRARRAGLPKRHTGRMLFNIFIDWLIGLVPVIGDLFDVGWKANLRNAQLLRRHYEREVARSGGVEIATPRQG